MPNDLFNGSATVSLKVERVSRKTLKRLKAVNLPILENRIFSRVLLVRFFQNYQINS